MAIINPSGFDASTGRKRKLETGDSITGNGTVPTGGSTGQALVKVSATNFDLTWSSMLPLAGGTLIGFLTLNADPTDPLHPVTLQYLQNYLKAWNWKEEVRVTDADANVVIASALENGDILNGVTLVTGDRVLLRNQTAPAENGIYIVPASGAATRATDMDVWTEVPGSVVVIKEGTLYADSVWLCTSNDGGTLGTTAISFTRIPTGAAVTGSFTAGQVSYASGTNALTSSANLTWDDSNSVLKIYKSNFPIVQWVNDNTGTTSGDGSIAGLNADGGMYLSNREASSYIGFYTASVERARYNNTGLVMASDLHMGAYRIGFGGVTSSFEIQLHNGSTNPVLQLTNASTGSTSADGSIIALDTDGSLALAQREAGLGIKHYVAGTDRLTVLSDKVVSNVPLAIGASTFPTIYDKIYAYSSSNEPVYIRVGNVTTGSTNTDGLILGMDADGTSYLWNYEASKALYFGAANTEAFRLDSSANVVFGSASGLWKHHKTQGFFGYNLTTPIRPIHIHYGTGNGIAEVKFTSDATGTTTSDGFGVGIDSDGTAYNWNRETQAFYFGTANTEAFRLDSSANVVFGSASGLWKHHKTQGFFGYNITTPVRPIHIHYGTGNGVAEIRFTSDTTGTTATDGAQIGMDSDGAMYVWTRENANLYMSTNNTVRFAITDGGNTNIGGLASTAPHKTQTHSQLYVLNNTAAQDVARFRGISSQSGNYINCLNSSDVSLFRVDSSGNVFASATGGDVYIENNRRLILRDSDNSNHVALKSPSSVSSNVEFTLPGADITGGGTLTTNGSGVISISSPANVGLQQPNISDDFLGGVVLTSGGGLPIALISENGWVAGGTSGFAMNFDFSFTDATNLGVLKLGVSTNASECWFNTGPNTNPTGAYAVEYSTRFYSESDGTDSERIGIFAGFFDNSAPNYAIAFINSYSTYSDTNWRAVTRVGGSITTTDTGQALSSSVTPTFKIIINAAGTSVTFYYDTLLVATHTTNIPQNSGVYGMGAGVLMKKTANNAARNIWIDWVRVISTAGSTRPTP